jgi:hypothetical protein
MTGLCQEPVTKMKPRPTQFGKHENTALVRRYPADGTARLMIPRNAAAVIAVMLETMWDGPS